MAGDWIKLRKSLMTDPKIVRISSALKADRLRTIGAVVSAWCLLDDHTEDGRLEGYTVEIFDELLCCAGLARAMASVDWMEIGDGFLAAPRFEEHNGRSAKRRMQETVRKKSARDADKRPHSKQEKSGPEKRREEKSKDIDPEISLCSIEQAISYASTVRMTADQARHWWNVRNASGWTKGSTGGGTPRRITSWQSDMATSLSWVAESMQKGQTAGKGRITPDIGGRKPAKVLDLKDAPVGAGWDEGKLEF